MQNRSQCTKLFWPCSLLLGRLAIGLADGPGAARAATQLVPEQYPTIQAAIDASATGDTV